MRRKIHARDGLAVLVLAVLMTAGCSAGEDASGTSAHRGRAGADREVTVIEPGRPGEPARTIDPKDLPVSDQFNHDDVAFVQMMIPHHAQALEMSRLARTRAEDPQVESLARRIRAAQAPEILSMAAWLQKRSIDVPKAGEDPAEYDHGAHGHSSMRGMLTDEQMHQLESARGHRFDRLFLERMIAHHEGAIAMADDVGREGADVRVGEMAADVVAGQSAEIERMRELLRQL